MALGKIVPKFDKKDFQKIVEAKLLRIDQALVMRLKRIGETFVKNARENGSYNDITGNLRNSVGYLILRDGVQLDSDFRKSAVVMKTIKRGKNTGKERKTYGSKEGVRSGKDFAFEVARKFPRGYVLIVVAGMEYASKVESKGKDVLTASSIIAEKDLREAIAAISKKIPRMQ
jgi:hypothetical protein